MIGNIKKTVLIAVAALVSPLVAEACTSAIIGADATRDGRPILWKHRDTSAIDNKVEYKASAPGEFAYTALYNAADTKLREAWMGMNEAGFAIMNTASYNIKDDKVAPKYMDREGILMAAALKKCRTVEDFARFLDAYPRPMGVEANFGVIDAEGNGAFFETNNHSYKRYDLNDAPNHVLIRTNYSISGRPNEGYGFVRYANAEHLLAPYIESRSVTPEVLTEILSRSFYHDLRKRDFAEGQDRWVVDQDFIPRYKSTASVAIEGVIPGKGGQNAGEEYIMWTALGYPPCAEMLPAWCRADGVDSRLRGTLPNGHSPLAEEAKKRRAEVFSIKKGNGDKYIDMTKLYNKEGTGYSQVLAEKNKATYERVRSQRDGKK